MNGGGRRIGVVGRIITRGEPGLQEDRLRGLGAGPEGPPVWCLDLPFQVLGSSAGVFTERALHTHEQQLASHTCLRRLPCFPAVVCAHAGVQAHPGPCAHACADAPACSLHSPPPGLSPTPTSQLCWWRSCFRSTWRSRRSHPQVTPFCITLSCCWRAASEDSRPRQHQQVRLPGERPTA